tara:strand:- start:6447 stop:6677 length:231 start_codon:yes stop_codon:yes gene_type:complete
MKGFIFTNFIDFVEKTNDIEMVDTMITESNLLIYTSSKGLTYFAIGLMKETLDFFKVNGKIALVENYNDTAVLSFI